MRSNPIQALSAMNQADISRIIEMAWEDKTPFEAIKYQFGLSESDVIRLMRNTLKDTSFVIWRERVSGRKTKHAATKTPGLLKAYSSSQYKYKR